ncbi:MAG: ATP-binding protein [Lachnospiraceae bacterium]|nr:ATP-binding protein [Lachnospiraceae bacterium]MDY4971560.1 ATP-binding protein [Lachnospiraceae bacterium]
MRSYRLYENVDPESNISGEDFDLVSQVNESMMLDRIFQVVREDIVKKGVGNCRSITFIHEHEQGLRVKNYYDMVIIMKNLLNNAIQAEAGEIKVLTEVSGDELVITVSDDGKGISPEHKPFIFTPRFSTKSKKQDETSGLGLYNVRKAIINSRGRFEMDSHPGQGTTCIVRFPLKEVLADSGQKASVLNSSKDF